MNAATYVCVAVMCLIVKTAVAADYDSRPKDSYDDMSKHLSSDTVAKHDRSMSPSWSDQGTPQNAVNHFRNSS